MRRDKWTAALMLGALLTGCGAGDSGEEDCAKAALRVYQAIHAYCLGKDCCDCECVTQGKHAFDSLGTCTCLDSQDHSYEDGFCSLDLIDYAIPDAILGQCAEGITCAEMVLSELTSAGWCETCAPFTCQALGAECGLLGDGCGGSVFCGSCPGSETCTASGQCVGGCTPTCTGRECGPDPTCGQSCGTCPAGQSCDDTGRCTCASHAVCDSSSVCIGGQCVPAYGRRYTFTIVSATVSNYDQAGEAWDWPGGMPDPIVCVYKNGAPEVTQALYCTAEKPDTFNPTYQESFQADVYASDSWTFRGIDSDVSSNDLIEDLTFPALAVSILKAGGFTRTSGTYLTRLEVRIVPVP